MTKSGYFLALLLFTVGAGLVAFNPSITGYVTGSANHESSLLIVLLGFLFIVTATLLIIAISYKSQTMGEEETLSNFHDYIKDSKVKQTSSTYHFKKK